MALRLLFEVRQALPPSKQTTRKQTLYVFPSSSIPRPSHYATHGLPIPSIDDKTFKCPKPDCLKTIPLQRAVTGKRAGCYYLMCFKNHNDGLDMWYFFPRGDAPPIRPGTTRNQTIAPARLQSDRPCPHSRRASTPCPELAKPTLDALAAAQAYVYPIPKAGRRLELAQLQALRDTKARMRELFPLPDSSPSPPSAREQAMLDYAQVLSLQSSTPSSSSSRARQLSLQSSAPSSSSFRAPSSSSSHAFSSRPLSANAIDLKRRHPSSIIEIEDSDDDVIIVSSKMIKCEPCTPPHTKRRWLSLLSRSTTSSTLPSLSCSTTSSSIFSLPSPPSRGSSPVFPWPILSTK
ncbi:hypothetical protein GGX14DRAFT_401963 [Mycena pura]|uniref:Uncharacterized protein n=1 Tax=Mycena pura TaxID=153505 RepID=A0AAD6Y7Q0_9AGAR|nr:hypothetical protein GGX14DRAFT_401963 [Mycena pura]